jgi:hypothetical protein
LRGVFQALDALVTYDNATKIVSAKKDNSHIELALGSSQATVNGRTVKLDVPAQQIHDRVVVPLRFIGEALGAYVKWSPDTGAVLIETVPPPR